MEIVTNVSPFLVRKNRFVSKLAFSMFVCEITLSENTLMSIGAKCMPWQCPPKHAHSCSNGLGLMCKRSQICDHFEFGKLFVSFLEQHKCTTCTKAHLSISFTIGDACMTGTQSWSESSRLTLAYKTQQDHYFFAVPFQLLIMFKHLHDSTSPSSLPQSVAMAADTS